MYKNPGMHDLPFPTHPSIHSKSSSIHSVLLPISIPIAIAIPNLLIYYCRSSLPQSNHSPRPTSNTKTVLEPYPPSHRRLHILAFIEPLQKSDHGVGG